MDFSFHDKRRCFHCDAPISDQAHGLRIFCEPKKLLNGSLYDCKEEYHMEAKKERFASVKTVYDYYRNFLVAVEFLLEKVGNEITLEQINQAGINLQRALVIESLPNRLFCFQYPTYKLRMISKATFIIERHELVL